MRIDHINSRKWNFSASLATVLLLWAAQVGAQSTYIVARALVDPVAEKLVQNPVVEIDGNRIVAVEPDGAVPEGARTIDLGGAPLVPGLADVHAHLSWFATDTNVSFMGVSHTDEAIRSVVNAKVLLMAGFTMVRNTGAGGYSDVSVRNAINAGWIPGPG